MQLTNIARDRSAAMQSAITRERGRRGRAQRSALSALTAMQFLVDAVRLHPISTWGGATPPRVPWWNLADRLVGLIDLFERMERRQRFSRYRASNGLARLFQRTLVLAGVGDTRVRGTRINFPPPLQAPCAEEVNANNPKT